MKYRTTYRTTLQQHWTIHHNDTTLDLSRLMYIISALDKTGSLSAAAKRCQLSYRHAWGVVRDAEQFFTVPLISTSRRQGSQLTEFALQLLHHYYQLNYQQEGALHQLQHEFDQHLSRLYRGEHLLLRLQASHGFAVESLLRHTRQTGSQPMFELHYRTGEEALMALAKKECDIAGFQMPMGVYQAPSFDHYRDYLSNESIMLVFLARRRVGLFVQKGNPLGIQGVGCLVRPDVRVVNRQPGSGSRLLMRLLLEEQQLDPELVLAYGATEFTHMAVAAHIASGMADVGFGIKTAASRCNLDFISLASERYFFAFHRDMMDGEAVQRFLSLLCSDEYRQSLQDLVGYDSEGIGQLYTPQDVFKPNLT